MLEPNIIIFAGATLIGLAVGALTGIFGIGGGFLLTPTLRASSSAQQSSRP